MPESTNELISPFLKKKLTPPFLNGNLNQNPTPYNKYP
jgi:hypothetical protein